MAFNKKKKLSGKKVFLLHAHLLLSSPFLILQMKIFLFKRQLLKTVIRMHSDVTDTNFQDRFLNYC